MLKECIIIKHLTLFILPYIFLYSLYIQINGEVSPGGGFQAGVIFASALIGFDLIYGKTTLISNHVKASTKSTNSKRKEDTFRYVSARNPKVRQCNCLTKLGISQYFSTNLLVFIATIGVLIYATTGAISFFFDDNYLNYYSLTKNKLLAQSIGIFVIEIGVGLTVSSVMYLIYSVITYGDD